MRNFAFRFYRYWVTTELWGFKPGVQIQSLSSVHFHDSACSLHFFPRKISSIPASLFMIFPCLCLTSISDLCPTVFQSTQSQSPLFFQCSLCLLARQVLVSTPQTPHYLFLCFTYNPRTMCDTLRSFLSVFGFPFHLQWFAESCFPFPLMFSCFSIFQMFSTPPHLPGFFYSWQMHLWPKRCLQRLLLPPGYLNYNKKKKVPFEQDSSPLSQR